jgi:class 3 adenylate cyclase/alpha-beta hydrolase superfamily lysophospholipase
MSERAAFSHSVEIRGPRLDDSDPLKSWNHAVTGEPRTQFARHGDAHVAYQITGDGPLDVVLLSEWSTPLEERWEQPLVSGPLHRLASFSRLISFDKRGIGLSDPLAISEVSTAEDWLEDLQAVLDTIGAERVALLGLGDGGPIAMLFAAVSPQRTAALVLGNTAARMSQADDYPWGFPPEAQQMAFDDAAADWVSGGLLGYLNPGLANDELFRDWWAKARRHQASPGAANAIYRMLFGLDVRRVLPSVQAPTLVLHRRDTQHITVEHGRYLAAHIPAAKYLELPGADHHWWAGDSDALIDEIELFLTGQRRPVESNRALATVLFTDIVDSTAQASTLGDRKWRQLLDRHDALTRAELGRFEGQEIKHLGDGFLVRFDGPARAVHCANAIRDRAQHIGLEIRAGLHTGEVELRPDDLGGVAVHIAARVVDLAEANEVLVSRTVKDLVAGSGIHFSDRGTHPLKGLPEPWQLYRVDTKS